MTPQVTSAGKELMTAGQFWDYCQLPENQNRWLELVRGEVIEVPRPTRRHGVVALEIGYLLRKYVEQIGRGYVASNDSGVILEEEPDTVVGPDVAYYTDANTFDELHPKWGEEPPLLAVEVLSPNDKPSKVNEKIADYLRNGVKMVWLVDYENRKVTVYRPDRSLVVLSENHELFGDEVLPGFTCRVGDFFRLPGDRLAKPIPPTT
jgi:Uma2 family endonuclease